MVLAIQRSSHDAANLGALIARGNRVLGLDAK
jgi:hypothetical protein